MKKNDILLVAVCVIVSAALSLILTNLLFSESSRQEKVEVVEKITDQFIQPEKRYFNENSINPTQLIQIGNNANQAQLGE
ncbi:hypothetical protein H0X10_01600 [Candidatus Saccharibacteria bacterium]|nr:hypothetical protein [Candidatus Saccharibacteria bacterium]